VTEGVDYVSSILSSDPPAKRLSSRETIAELLIADLGELPTASPYLIVCDISWIIRTLSD
jgi:cleavage and polyadenylation specificity factor subunit 1